jgi:hypothetical protein
MAKATPSPARRFITGDFYGRPPGGAGGKVHTRFLHVRARRCVAGGGDASWARARFSIQPAIVSGTGSLPCAQRRTSRSSQYSVSANPRCDQCSRARHSRKRSGVIADLGFPARPAWGNALGQQWRRCSGIGRQHVAPRRQSLAPGCRVRSTVPWPAKVATTTWPCGKPGRALQMRA